MTHYQSYPLNNTSTLTRTRTDLPVSSETLVKTIIEAADDRKAAELVVLNVAQVSYLSDYFVIATGFSTTQVRAISDAIMEKVAQKLEKNPLRIEGTTEANWILQDYGDVIVHIFLPAEREFYNLEAFWGHAQRFDLASINSLP